MVFDDVLFCFILAAPWSLDPCSPVVSDLFKSSETCLVVARESRLAVGQWQLNSGPSPQIRIEAKPHKCQFTGFGQLFRVVFVSS